MWLCRYTHTPITALYDSTVVDLADWYSDAHQHAEREAEAIENK